MFDRKRMESISEAMSSRFMVCLVAYQCVPRTWSESVARQVRINDAGKLWITVIVLRLFGNNNFFFIYIYLLRVETYDKDAFAMLRNPSHSIYDFPIYYIAKFVLQRAANDFKSVTLIVRKQILNIFQHERTWTFQTQNFLDFKEESPLCFILKAVLAAKSVFLGNASEGERLAWESCTENIVVRNRLLGNSTNVTVWNFAEVPSVSLFCMNVPFAGKHTFTSCFLKRNTEATNSSKKVNERKVPLVRGGIWQIFKQVEKILGVRFRFHVRIFLTAQKNSSSNKHTVKFL